MEHEPFFRESSDQLDWTSGWRGHWGITKSGWTWICVPYFFLFKFKFHLSQLMLWVFSFSLSMVFVSKMLERKSFANWIVFLVVYFFIHTHVMSFVFGLYYTQRVRLMAGSFVFPQFLTYILGLLVCFCFWILLSLNL